MIDGFNAICLVEPAEGISFDLTCDVLVIGAGASGLITALRAREAGAEVLVLERDSIPRGSTALSAGLIPAAGTRFQKSAGLADSRDSIIADIMAKAHGEPDIMRVKMVVDAVGPALEWLADHYGFPFSVIDNFRYPGHSSFRMHGLPSRSGAELMDRLISAAAAEGVDVVTQARATKLYATADRKIAGVAILRPDGKEERVACRALVLACNGYGGNRALVAEQIPSMANALYFGHPGNQGEALIWGRALGAATAHLSGHQGHGSVAHPHGILITWATITEGGFQVNNAGLRFANEAAGYSESAASVIAQPEALAWTIFDARIAGIARQFEDFRMAEAAGAIIVAGSEGELAARTGLPFDALASTMSGISRLKAEAGADKFGRSFAGLRQLEAPFAAVRVTGALFHTQGGLLVNEEARVLQKNGTPFQNLFAVGGAACGVSGSGAAGYLSGNGLLIAFADGFIAGQGAAGLARSAHFPRERGELDLA